MEPMGKQVMQPVTKPEPKPISLTDPKVLAETHVKAGVNSSTYQALQEQYFGAVLTKDNRKVLSCADIPLDSYSKTSRVEKCRVIADGDMRVSATDIFRHAMEETGFLAKKGLAPIDLQPYSLSFATFFRRTHKNSCEYRGCDDFPHNASMLVSLAALDSVMKEAGVEIKAPVETSCYEGFGRDGVSHTYEHTSFNIRSDVNALKADNKAFRTFWSANSSTSLPVQNVFDVLQEQLIEHLDTTSKKEPATQQAEVK